MASLDNVALGVEVGVGLYISLLALRVPFLAVRSFFMDARPVKGSRGFREE